MRFEPGGPEQAESQSMKTIRAHSTECGKRRCEGSKGLISSGDNGPEGMKEMCESRQCQSPPWIVNLLKPLALASFLQTAFLRVEPFPNLFLSILGLQLCSFRGCYYGGYLSNHRGPHE